MNGTNKIIAQATSSAVPTIGIIINQAGFLGCGLFNMLGILPAAGSRCTTDLLILSVRTRQSLRYNRDRSTLTTASSPRHKPR